MNTTNHDIITNKQEIEALKDMIFKRARERAEALSKDAQENYTTSMQNDIMENARISFNTNKNPFSTINNETETKTYSKKEIDYFEKEVQNHDNDNIGFEIKKAEQIKAQIELKNKISHKENINNMLNDTISDTRKDFVSRSNFMGALDFLNSQATITLINSKGKKFEALA